MSYKKAQTMRTILVVFMASSFLMLSNFLFINCGGGFTVNNSTDSSSSQGTNGEPTNPAPNNPVPIDPVSNNPIPINPEPKMKIPTGIAFDSSVYRSGGLSDPDKPIGGDNFCNTWADDDRTYMAVDDGFGWPIETAANEELNTRVWALEGGPTDLTPIFLDNFPKYPIFSYFSNGAKKRHKWYGFGIISVQGTLYYSITLPYKTKLASKLLYSHDHGKSWYRHDGALDKKDNLDEGLDKLFFKDPSRAEGHRFAYLEYVQMGKDYELSRVFPGDTKEYVYVYSKKEAPRNAIFHARVPKDHESITDPNAYEYFLGYNGDKALWTRNVLKAYEFPVPDGYFHSAWLPNVVYNPGLNVFIMSQGGRPGGEENGLGKRCLPNYKSRLIFSWAPNPWGPWKKFYDNKNWVADHPGNSLYQPKIVPKFTSEDGKTMYLNFSDCREWWGKNYVYNQQRMTITTD